MKKKILLLCLIILFVVSFSNNYIRVKADSGWDTDYDSSESYGGGYWGGSDYDFDYDSGLENHHNYSLENVTTKDVILAIIYIVLGGFSIFVFCWLIGKTTNSIVKMLKGEKRISNKYTYIEEDIIKSIIPNFNKKLFLENAYQMFVDIQNNWSNFNYDELRKLLSDELFNTYNSQLKALKLQKRKNVMKDFEKHFINISDFNYNNGKSTIKVVLLVSFIDFIENKNGRLTRGNRKNKVNNAYKLTFISSNLENNDKRICPNCHSILEKNVTNECPYCKARIIHHSYDWVMSKKELFSTYFPKTKKKD